MNKFFDWLRRLKEWVEGFSEKRYAMFSLFLLAFAESSFFPIPPDVLLIAIAISIPKKSLNAAFWCTVGSVFGGVLGYYIGWGLMETVGKTIIEFYNGQQAWATFIENYQEYGTWFLAAAAFSPIPYKISTIASGAAKMNLFIFITISSLGRAGRFFIVGGLIYFIGPKVKVFIDKYFEKLSLAFVVLLFAGFIAVKYFF